MTRLTVKEKYEVHHGVRITDSALVAACVNAARYVSDRFLPDKVLIQIHAKRKTDSVTGY